MALFRRNRVWWMGFSYYGKQVRRSTEVTDKKVAEKIYHKVRTQIAEGKWYEPAKGADKTVKELLERYLRDHSTPNKSPSSQRSDRSVSVHLIRAFGDLTSGNCALLLLQHIRLSDERKEQRPRPLISS